MLNLTHMERSLSGVVPRRLQVPSLTRLITCSQSLLSGAAKTLHLNEVHSFTGIATSLRDQCERRHLDFEIDNIMQECGKGATTTGTRIHFLDLGSRCFKAQGSQVLLLLLHDCYCPEYPKACRKHLRLTSRLPAGVSRDPGR